MTTALEGSTRSLRAGTLNERTVSLVIVVCQFWAGILLASHIVWGELSAVCRTMLPKQLVTCRQTDRDNNNTYLLRHTHRNSLSDTIAQLLVGHAFEFIVSYTAQPARHEAHTIGVHTLRSLEVWAKIDIHSLISSVMVTGCGWGTDIYGTTTTDYMVLLQTIWYYYRLYGTTTDYMVLLQTIWYYYRYIWYYYRLYGTTTDYMVLLQTIWYYYRLYGTTTDYMVLLQIYMVLLQTIWYYYRYIWYYYTL